MLEGRSEDLARVFPPCGEPSDEALWRAIDAALGTHEAFICERLESPPQTNEVRRAAALLPGFLTIAARTKLPLVLSEIGASAGLNLHWDQFGYRLGDTYWGDLGSPVQLAPEWVGPSPPTAAIEVLERAGCDRAPLDPNQEQDRLRLLSYIWADQRERFGLTAAALEIARASSRVVERSDALSWLEARLSKPPRGMVHVVYQTIVWPYLDATTQRTLRALLADAGKRAAALAWLRLEPDGGTPGAALTLTLWPSGEERLLARADFHGRWIEWRG